MSGPATFSGTTYQSRVTAYVYVHILAQMRLGWFTPADDTPIAVSAETGGAGDDARIDFGERHAPAEVQAKHGLTGKAKALEVIEAIRDNDTKKERPRVAVALDRTSSRSIYVDLARDLDGMRGGRTDGFRPETEHITKGLGEDFELLKRVSVIVLDLDKPHDAERKSVMVLLGSVLEDAAQADLAWSRLVDDAGDIAARRLRRTRKDLVDILALAGIKVKPPAADDRWHRQLDFTRSLLERRHAEAALATLAHIESDLGQTKTEPRVRYRLRQQRAAAQLQLERLDAALDSARRALDMDADGSHALVTAATAAMLLGNLGDARRFVDHALAIHPNDPSVWGIEAGLAVAEGKPSATPPAAVAETAHYRRFLAHLAEERGDCSAVLSLTASLLAEGDRAPDILLLRANVLLSEPRAKASAASRERELEAERLATELLELLNDDAHPLTPKAYVLRSEARQRLGKAVDAESDLTLARVTGSDDLDAIMHSALAAFNAGNDQAAIQFLRHPAVETQSQLLAMRARILVDLKDNDAARRDIAKAVSQLSDARNPDNSRLAIADAALAMGDTDVAERALAGLSQPLLKDVRYHVLVGGLSFLKGDYDAAEASFRHAVSLAPSDRLGLLTELGQHFLRASQPDRAAKVFRAIGLEELPSHAWHPCGVAFMRTNDFQGAQQLLDHMSGLGALPEWALQLATDLALKQEDVDKAIIYLSQLVARPEASRSERIELARRLIERDRIDDAQPHLDMLLSAAADLSPVEQMQTAQLLAQSGRDTEAIPLAFRAFRNAQQDPQFHRALIALALRSHGGPVSAAAVGPDTHVSMHEEGGGVRQHTIYEEPPIDPLRDEMTVADAGASGLLGKKAGEVVLQNPESWNERQWIIDEILPAFVHVVRDAMLHYEDRFPSEPFFMTGFQFGDGTSVKALARLVGSLEAGKANVAKAFGMYREQIFPLGFVVRMAGGTIAEAMAFISTDETRPGPLFVEWSDKEGQAVSRDSATAATTVVLSRSALKTAQDLGLLDMLSRSFKLMAPRSLRDAVRNEAREADEAVSTGQHTLMSSTGGLASQELEPDHPYLVRRRDRLRELLKWLEAAVVLEARPLDTIAAPGSRDEMLRELIGSDSYDALMLCKHHKATLYADDLGLRRMLPDESGKKSFSTVSLVPSLAERTVITAAKRDELLLMLVQRRFAVVAPTRELLNAAVATSTQLGHSRVREVFELFAGPSTSADEAAWLIAQVLRTSALADVQMLSLGEITGLGLTAMSTRWRPELCALVVARAAAAEMRLMPQHLKLVQQTCIAFVKGGASGASGISKP